MEFDLFFTPQIYLHESHKVIKKFIDSIGEKQILRYFERLATFAASGHFASLYVKEFFKMELGILDIVSDVIEKPDQPISEEYITKHIEALGFISAFVEITERSPEYVKLDFTCKVQGLMNDLRTLHDTNLELQTAISLMQKGWTIRFLKNQIGTFDTLAIKGNLEIEVECKFFSSDKGKKIHSKETALLGDQLAKSLDSYLGQKGKSELFLISFNDSLPTNTNFIQQVSNKLKEYAEESTEPDSSIRCSFEKYELNLEKDSDEETFQDKLLEHSRTIIKQDIKKVLYLERKETNTKVAIALTSKKRDNTLGYIYKELKKSANSQFSKSRACMFNCYLEGIDHHSLPSLASNSGLQAVSGRIFRNEDRRHIKQINYLVKPTPSVSSTSTQSFTSVLSFPSSYLTEEEKKTFGSIFS